ncbi:MAG: hypothetical protein ACK5HT_07755 [Draconibacterium sp.]
MKRIKAYIQHRKTEEVYNALKKEYFMKINIKNMVCNRCIMMVSQIFKEPGV